MYYAVPSALLTRTSPPPQITCTVVVAFFIALYFVAKAVAIRLGADTERLRMFRVTVTSRLVLLLSVVYIVMSKARDDGYSRRER